MINTSIRNGKFEAGKSFSDWSTQQSKPAKTWWSTSDLVPCPPLIKTTIDNWSDSIISEQHFAGSISLQKRHSQQACLSFIYLFLGEGGRVEGRKSCSSGLSYLPPPAFHRWLVFFAVPWKSKSSSRDSKTNISGANDLAGYILQHLNNSRFLKSNDCHGIFIRQGEKAKGMTSMFNEDTGGSHTSNAHFTLSPQEIQGCLHPPRI